MAGKTKGRFYLKKTSNGNLIGEYSNYPETGVFTEGCDLITPTPDANPNAIYLGDYASHWQEGQRPIFANLKIARKPGSTLLFHLKWDGGNGAASFEGEAMFCDDILVGDYHQT